jgi:4-amino-4-deoxy-L-arabinose transferase-like glycosyltransferase
MSVSKKTILALLLGLCVRIAFLVWHPGNNYLSNKLYVADSYRYNGVAVNLLSGCGYTENGETTARTMPAYPFFLAFVYGFFGHNAVAVRFIQIFLVLLACYIIYLTAKELFDERAGITALFLSVLYYPFIQMPAYIVTESLFMLFLVLSVYFSVKVLKSPEKLGYIFLAGISSGVLVLTRPVGIFVPLLLFVFVLLQPVPHRIWYGIKRTGIFLLVFFILLAPWVIRNYIVYRTFFPLSSEAGITMYRGNNPAATGGTGGWHSIGVDTISGFPEEIKGMNDVEASNYLKNLAVRYIRDNPSRFLYLCWRRFLNMWRPFYSGSNLINKIILPIWDILILYPLGLLGIILGIREKGRERIISLFLLSFLFLYNLLCIMSVAVIRYRYPIMPILIIFSSWPITRLVKRYEFDKMTGLKKQDNTGEV